MKRRVHEGRGEKRESGAADYSRYDLDGSGERRDLSQVVRIAVQRVGDEPDRRSAESEIEQDEVFGDPPSEADETESGWAHVSRRHRHDEERGGEGTGGPNKV